MGRNDMICLRCGHAMRRQPARMLCWVCRRAANGRYRSPESRERDKVKAREKRRANMATLHAARGAADYTSHPGVATDARIDYLAARYIAGLPLFDEAPPWTDRLGKRRPGNLRGNGE